MTRILALCAAASLTIYVHGITYSPEGAAYLVEGEPIVVMCSEEYEDPDAITPEEAISFEEMKISQAQAELDEIEAIGDSQEWFIAYKNIISNYEEWIDAPESIYDVYTEDEIYLMCRVIETETHGLEFSKKCNVASVILNRIEHEQFGDTATKVCTAAGQFSYSRTKIEDDTLLALEYAFMIEDTTGGALYFHSNDYIPETWNGATLIMTDGSHAFYG